MTEEEARKKWCPHVRQSAVMRQEDGREHLITYNRSYTENLPGCRCIAADCMAWRWESKPIPGNRTNNDFDVPGSDTPGIGYCGLAGKP